MKRRTLLMSASAQLLCVACGQALAQAPASYPSRPIRLVVPFAVGHSARHPGPTGGPGAGRIDVGQRGGGKRAGRRRHHRRGPRGQGRRPTAIRCCCSRATPRWCSPAAPMASSRPTTRCAIWRPIAQLMVTPNVLVVANDVPARTCRNWWRWCAASRASSAIRRRHRLLAAPCRRADEQHGGPGHGARAQPGQPLADVISGRTQLLFGNIAAALPMMKDGKVRALAVTSTTREPRRRPSCPRSARAACPASSRYPGSACSRRQARRRPCCSGWRPNCRRRWLRRR
jgi:hypothetical protein